MTCTAKSSSTFIYKNFTICITVLFRVGIDTLQKTMKLLLLLSAVVAIALCRPEEGYSTQYDNFDAQELASNVRLLKNYGKCFLDKGPCTSEGSDFKKTIPDAVRTKCVKCNPKQRELIRIVVKALQTKLPDLWQELVKKEDPNGLYKADFDAFLNASD